MGHDTFKVGELTAVIGDNASHGGHRAGYNGIWSLTRSTCERTLFVPAYAGLNHEHIFNGDAEDDPALFFEPRTAPMTFRRLSENEAELHQEPTPNFHLESWTRFRLTPPHYVDMHYRCVAHQHVFSRGYIGLFWASYINGPLDKSLYFLGGLEGQPDLWTQFCTQRHNDESTVLHREDQTELAYREDGRETLFRSLSLLRFGSPFYYGLFDDHVWILMFDRADGIRFSHSPSGGGVNSARRTSNPAWDFQFIVPGYQVSQSYEFRARGVLRPRCSRDDIVAEYQRWKEQG